MVAVLLALGSSLAYGISDFLGGLSSKRLAPFGVLLVSQGAALLVLLVLVVVTVEAVPAGRYLGWAVLAGVSEAVGVAALYRGLAVGKMGVVSPIGAAAPVIPVVAAVPLGEAPGPLQAVGIVLTLVGIVALSVPDGDGGGDGTTGRSVRFGVLTAFGFGGYFVFTDQAAEGSVLWALLLARVASVACLGVAAAALRQPVAVGRRDLAPLAAIGLLVLVADALYALAVNDGELAVVAVLSSLFPVVTVVLARVVLDERLTPRQLAGALVAFSGVALVAARSG